MQLAMRGARVLICGNKCDLQEEREVSREEGERLAANFGAPYVEASALEDYNVRETFSTASMRVSPLAVCTNIIT